MTRTLLTELRRWVSVACALTVTSIAVLGEGGCGDSKHNSGGAQCRDDADCAEGSLCHESGVCIEQCWVDDECADNEVCRDHRCVATECRFNSDCGPNGICTDLLCKRVEQCVTDEHCGPTGTCDAGQCRGSGMGAGGGGSEFGDGEPCESNRDCRDRTYCIDGVCRLSIECLTHAHCPPGQACFRNLCWTLK